MAIERETLNLTNESAHTFADGQSVVLLSNEAGTSGWLALKPNEVATITSFGKELVSSSWFRFRFPNLQPLLNQSFLLVITADNGNLTNPKIINSDNNSLDTSESNYKFRVHETIEATENNQGANADQKPVMDAFAQQMISSNNALALIDYGDQIIYLIQVDEDIAARYHPTENISAPIKVGQFLVVGESQSGKITFYSSNFGKAKLSAKYDDWSPDQKGSTIKSAIDAATKDIPSQSDKSATQRKILSHLLYKLTGANPKEDFNTTVNRLRQSQLSRLEEFGLGGQFIATTDAVRANGLRLEELQKATFEKTFAHSLNQLPEHLFAELANQNLSQNDLARKVCIYLAAKSMKDEIDNLFDAAFLYQQGLIDQHDLLGGTYSAIFESVNRIVSNEAAQLAFLNMGASTQVEMLQPDLDKFRLKVGGIKFNDIIQGRVPFHELIVFPNDPDKEYHARLYTPGPPEIEAKDLGEIIVRNDIPEINEAGEQETHLAFRDYSVQYPPVIVEALAQIFQEYNQVFQSLIKKNQEWPDDYKYCQTSEGKRVNPFVQIDMKGLPEQLISQLVDMPVEAVVNILKPRIFEIENSLARYNLMRGIFSWNGQPSRFQQNMDAALDRFREKYHRPVALLAVTKSKYEHMLATEFGLTPDDPRRHNPEYIHALSGFDYFFGPEDFDAHLAENNGECQYILYSRTSLPLDILQNPGSKIDIPLLQNPQTRKVIRENSISFNIDDLDSDPQNAINDTKAYLEPMGMGFTVTKPEDLDSPEFLAFLAEKGLVNADGKIKSELNIRLKPVKGFYGCYQHIREQAGSKTLAGKLKNGLKIIKEFVAQAELTITRVFNTNPSHPGSIGYIDRLFLYTEDGTPEKTMFIGGLRNLIPDGEVEMAKGNVHGNFAAIWAEIFA